MSWEPDAQALAHVLQLLEMSGSQDSAVQRQLVTSMDEFKKHPLCINYLAYVVTQMPERPKELRTMAAVLLKKTIELQFAQTADKEYVKQCAIVSLKDPEAMIRMGISTVVTTIVTVRGLQAWPQIWPFLLDAIDSTDTYLVDGAMRSLEKIIEDIPTDLDVGGSPNEMAPLSPLIPKLVAKMAPQQPRHVRRYALGCLHYIVDAGCKSMAPHFESFLGALLAIANDEDAQLRKLVCQILVRLLDVNPQILLPHFASLIEYMLLRTKDDDVETAMEACEFWLAVPEVPEMADLLHDHLQRIVPVLVECMAYSEDDLAILTAQDEDEAVPDRDNDIAPRHHTGKAKGESSNSLTENPGAKTYSGAASLNKANREFEDGELDSDAGDHGDNNDDDNNDDEDDEDHLADWNLRKCAASALDLLGVMYASEILPHLLPVVERLLSQPDWVKRECAILALGAVAEGSIDGLVSHLPHLVPFLLQNLKDPQPLVRSISAWTLSRFANWVCEPPRIVKGQTLASAGSALFASVLEASLTAILDRNKRVQEAAISAFAVFAEEANEQLEPYLGHILQALSSAFTHYQHKNSLRLLEAIGTLADNVEGALNRPEYVALIMPPIINKWGTIADDSDSIFPLLECVASLSLALGDGFRPFAAPVWTRCVGISLSCIKTIEQYNQAPETSEMPNRDFLIAALDLISGIIQSVGTEHARELISTTQPPLMDIIMRAYQETQPDVRQSVYAIIGDLASTTFEVIAPHVEALLPILIASMGTVQESVPMCNNAVWAAGEIAMKYPNMRPYAASMVGTLVQILNRQSTSQTRTLAENAAITLGRLSQQCSDVIAPHLPSFVESWLKTMHRTKDNVEKIDAFRGLVALVQANPGAVSAHIVAFVDALCFWQAPPADLRDAFHQLMHAYKQMYTGNWDDVVASLPERTKSRYNALYK